MQTIRNLDALREYGKAAHGSGKLALVPTMGALHDGHLSLIEVARNHADTVLVSIFINPKQFGPNEDFSRYPRQEEMDLSLLERADVNAVWLPDVVTMYPQEFATNISVSGLTNCLCGASRPGHFDGVATVVTKLLLQTLPDVAVFGEKDFQQLLVIRRVVDDVNIPVEIIGAPTLREADGLAMSSRNRYLSPEKRRIAPKLHATLKKAVHNILQGMPVTQAEAIAKDTLLHAGFNQLDYLECRHAETLERTDTNYSNARLFAAARLGSTRLIDNIGMTD